MHRPDAILLGSRFVDRRRAIVCQRTDVAARWRIIALIDIQRNEATMDHSAEHHAYIAEVWRRFEEVQQWAIEHWPDAAHPISSSDFVEARKEILGLGQKRGGGQRQEAEPADGGAQYIDVTPTPWP